MSKVRQVTDYVRCYGWRSLLFRLKYEFQLKSGQLRKRFPVRGWGDVPLASWLENSELARDDRLLSHLRGRRKPSFFFDGHSFDRIRPLSSDEVIARADEIRQGILTYFSRLKTGPGSVPAWFANPFTGQWSVSDRAWTDIHDFDANQGDIKFIWEPSRFAWVYPLVRAYAATRDERYAEHFWRWFDDWIEKNPPNVGPSYKCGQECAVRCLAVCFALNSFLNCSSSTSERVSRALTMLAVHADRIEKNLDYARWQKNNHAVSEANGLYTIGILFPELKSAKRWRELGKRVLEEEGLRQIYPDGAYVQHSMNYHRVMLQNYLWAVRLGEVNGDEFSAELRSRLVKATEFLFQMTDPKTGKVPNYGSNDGALILPLDSCDYLDFRPVVQSCWYLLKRERLFDAGPWDEDMFWLFGPEALNAPRSGCRPASSAFYSGGYYTLRGEKSWGMIRCHTYRDRPSQADMLHLDVWHDGVNILRDSGTYSYFAAPPWDTAFVLSSAHNVIRIDGQESMRKGPRFTWFDWARAERHVFRVNGAVQTFCGSLLSYEKLPGRPVHRRTVCLIEPDVWIVVDDVLGAGEHRIDQFWQIGAEAEVRLDGRQADLACQGVRLGMVFASSSDTSLEVREGREDPPTGWTSLYYGERVAAPTIVQTAVTALPVRLVTVLAPSVVKVEATDRRVDLTFADGGRSTIDLADIGSESVVVNVNAGRNS